MSDFDKEAEREKLREKYEQDEKEREATERMSDLLLKGATMTNAHCGACGDPIFRHEGKEFCPTCQKVLREDGEPVEGAENGETPADAATDADESTDAETTEVNEATEATAADVDTDEAGDSPADTQSPPSPDTQSTPSPGSTTTPSPNRGATGSPDSGVDPSPDPATPTRSTTGRDASVADSAVSTGPTNDPSSASETAHAGAGNLADARATLSATVTELAANARQSDDLERTRAYLAAVEEAADALAAVKRADR